MKKRNTIMRATAAETRHSLIFRLEEASDPNLTSGYRDILQAWLRSRSLEQEMRGRIQRLLEQVGTR